MARSRSLKELAARAAATSGQVGLAQQIIGEEPLSQTRARSGGQDPLGIADKTIGGLATATKAGFEGVGALQGPELRFGEKLEAFGGAFKESVGEQLGELKETAVGAGEALGLIEAPAALGPVPAGAEVVAATAETASAAAGTQAATAATETGGALMGAVVPVVGILASISKAARARAKKRAKGVIT